MKKWLVIVLSGVLLLLLVLALWVVGTIPRFHPLSPEEVALDATDLAVLRKQEENRARLKAAAFRSHTRAWFRDFRMPDHAVYTRTGGAPPTVGETVLETHSQHWFLGDDWATSETLLELGSTSKGGKLRLTTRPVSVRTASHDGYYSRLTHGRYGALQVERYRYRDMVSSTMSGSRFELRGEWAYTQEHAHMGGRYHAESLRRSSPGRFSVSWTTQTLNGTNLLRRRFVDTGSFTGRSRVISDALFDPSKGSEAVHLGPQDYTHSALGLSHCKATTDIDVREVVPGLWFPVRYNMEVCNTSGTLVATIVSEIDLATASFNRPEDVPESAFVIELPPGSEWDDYRYGPEWEMLSSGEIFEELWEEVEQFFGKIMP